MLQDRSPLLFTFQTLKLSRVSCNIWTCCRELPHYGAVRRGREGWGGGKSIGVRVTEKHFLTDPESGEADQVA